MAVDVTFRDGMIWIVAMSDRPDKMRFFSNEAEASAWANRD